MTRILYFANLVDRLGRTYDDLALPETVQDVRGLLTLLRNRGGAWEQALLENKVRVLVNKEFASLETRIADGSEIAVLSTAPS